MVGAFKSHPYLIAGTAIAAIGATAYTVYKNIKQGYIESATEATSVWEDSKTSLEDYASKYKELKSQLESGNLSEAETISIKQQILDIQNQITSAYGESASGIDLINGKLDTQLAKMQSISQEEAQRNINQNREAYEDAEYEMKKERRYEIGSLSAYNIDSNDDYNKANKAIRDLVKDFEDRGLYLEDNGYTARIVFKGDATQADEVINEFESKVESMKSLYGENNAAIDSVLTNASSSLQDNQTKILDNYQEIYRSYMEQQLFSKGYGDELLAYSNAIDNYNNALLSGDTSKIQEAKQAFQEANTAKEQLLSEDGNSDFGFLFDEFTEKLDTATIKYNDFQEALTSDSLSDDNQFKNQAEIISKASDELKKLELNAVDVATALSTDGFQNGEEPIRRLAVAWGLTADTMTPDNIQAFADALAQAGIVIGEVSDSVIETEKSLEELTQSANDVVSSISSINSVLSSQGTGKSISSEIFSNDELKDYQSALEYVNGCYQLNTEKVKELTEAKVDEAIATNNTKKAIEQQNYLKNAKEIDSLRKKIEENNFVGDENAEIIQTQIDNLLEQNSAIISNCNQLDVLNASLMESIGIYQQWKDAQNAGNSGDMFDDAGTAWSQIRDIADKESDMYGRVGTVQYQAAVDFLVPEEIDHSDQKAVQKYLDSIRKYMYFDDNGDVNGINMDNFFKSAVDKGLMVETEDSYEIAGQMTMQKFAEGMGMSLPLVQAIFGEIEEFMPEGDKWFDWSDEAVQSLGDLAIVASDAADALQSTEQFKNMDIQIDVSDLSTTEEQISALDATIAQMNQVKATPGVDTSQIEDANAIIQYCVQQKQALNEPAVMSVDTSLVEGQIGEAISLLQQFQQAQNELEMQKTLGLDTSEAESKVSNLTSEIQALNPKVTASLGIDPASTETIASTISALTPKMMVEAGVDDKAIIGYQADDKKAMVVYGVDHRKVDAYNPQNLERTVTYSVITQGNVPSGSSSTSNASKTKSGKNSANGTAHAYGTALANGAWGAKQGGMTLVGELGQELLVHVRSGNFETIGDNGAEFIHVEPGDIIFNHLQTEELLKNGYTASRAQALVSGTAFASGNAMVTGGIPKSVTTIRNKNQKTTEKKSTDKNTKATNKNTAATEKNTEATENLQDWIEYSTNLQSKENDRLYNAIESFEMHANQNSAIDAYITDSQAYMNTLRRAQNAYMSKANALGLDANYIHKIWAGDDLSIEDIQDEALRDKIEKYQQWYIIYALLFGNR